MACWQGSYHNLFDVTGNSLPGLLSQIPALNDEHRCNQVCQALRVTSAVYKTQMHNNYVRINWNDPVYQCAYVFLYFTKHSHLVYETLFHNAGQFELAWRYNSDIKLCSIGGGPGSDIAGLIAFLDGTNFGPALRCVVLDLYPEWQRSWQAIRPNLPSRLHGIDVIYHRFNLVQNPPFSAEVSASVRNADLVTFVKSFSTVSTEQSVYLNVLPAIMNNVKPGAFVLLIDNSAAEVQINLFKQIAQEAGLNILQDHLHETPLSLSTFTNMNEYSRRFNYKPLRSCSVRVCLMAKPLMCPLAFSWQVSAASSDVPDMGHPSQEIHRQTQNSTNPGLSSDYQIGASIYRANNCAGSNIFNQRSSAENTPTITMLSQDARSSIITSSESPPERPAEPLESTPHEKRNSVCLENTKEYELSQNFRRTSLSSSSLSSSSSSSSLSSISSQSVVHVTEKQSPVPWDNLAIAIMVVFVTLMTFFA